MARGVTPTCSAGILKIERRHRRQLVVDLGLLIKEIRVDDHLITEDLVLGVHKSAVALRVRQFGLVTIEREMNRAVFRENIL